MSTKLVTESYIKEKKGTDKSGLKTFGDCLKHNANVFNKKEAVVFASSDGKDPRQVVTWRELYDKSLSVAKAFIKLGVQKDEVVALNIRTCPEWLYLAFGAILAGARIVGISFTYTDGSDLVALMNRLKTCSLLALDPGADGKNWEIVKGVVQNIRNGEVFSKQMPYLRYLIGHQFKNETTKLLSTEDLIFSEHNDVVLPEISSSDIAILFQTSGSTGVPKLAAHTHDSLNYRHHVGSLDFFDTRTRVFNDRPFNWIGGFPVGVLQGQTRVTISGFGKPASDPVARMIDVITEEKCVLAMVLPPLLSTWIERQDTLPFNWPVKTVTTGGQPLTKKLAEALGRVCKKIICAYGATEAGFVAFHEVKSLENFNDYSCGNLISGSGAELKVVSKDGLTVPLNQQGELYIRSSVLFSGYYNDPEKTSSVMTDDGWYKTDDLGRVTETGEIFVEGRKSNIIISGGMNVAPEILETAVKSYPGVHSSVIVPIPDAVYYQVLCACIQPIEGYMVTEKELREFCKTIHNDKPGLFTVLPKFYVFMNKFPETSTGKLSRMELTRIVQQKIKHN